MSKFINIIRSNYRSSISKSNVIDFWTFQICRRIASVIVALITKTSITPNSISWISFILNLSAGFYLLKGEYLISCSIYWFSCVLDCVDGQLALQKGIISEYGKYLDLLLDALKDIITFALLFVLLFDTSFMWFAFISMIVVSISLVFDWIIKTQQKQIKPKKSNTNKSVKLKFGIIFWSYPIRNFVIVVSLFFTNPGWISIYGAVIGGYLTIQNGYKILNKVK